MGTSQRLRNPLENQRAMAGWAGAATGFQTKTALAVPKSHGNARTAAKTIHCDTKSAPGFLSRNVFRIQMAMSA